ncbi:hypothetical protein AAMO2058_000037000 [Amorphochlora amoebiformis]
MASSPDSGLIRGNVSIRRRPIVDFLTVKGAETVRKWRKPFKMPERVGEPKFQTTKRKKRGRLGSRGWRRVVKVGKYVPLERTSYMPPDVAFEDDISLEDTSIEAPRQASPLKICKESKEKTWERLILWEPPPEDLKQNPNLHTIEVEDILCKWLRPHQRDGVQFCVQCVLGQNDFNGCGVILADDMGLGKTLQAITVLYTLLRQGIEKGKPTVSRAVVVCPTSLVGNWQNELGKWLKGKIQCIAVTQSGPAKVEAAISDFLSPHVKANVLILSYDTFRRYAERFNSESACGLLICDEAHRLKNAKTATYKTLNQLHCKRRILLSGTPMQNDLDEFFAMVNFTNPEVLGDRKEFRKYYEIPILAGREPDCLEEDEKVGLERSSELSAIVNQFILRRTNVLLSKHLPPKVIQVVCCRPTSLQERLYKFFINQKSVKQMVKEGEKRLSRVLPLINNIKRLCNHPKLIWGSLKEKNTKSQLRGCQRIFEQEAAFLRNPGHPRFSGKMEVLDRLLCMVKKETDDRVVLVSNYTQTLDVFEDMCKIRKWGFIRLDGSIQVKNRSKLVKQLDDKSNNKFLFLLSSKAGGCGLNLVGANRLVLFDPDWNPAVDKQAAARVWRDGQTKRCFVYRFLTTGTIEEKVYQRQLSKEGLQGVLAGAATDAGVSMKDLRDLFTLTNTPSNTHDTVDCSCLSLKENTAQDKCLQGQRGHPKEEDLLNWAHHCSSSSVPDPIFRLSHNTNSEDYVSFVFSCEIRGREMPMEDTQQAAAVSALCDEDPVITKVAEKKGIEVTAAEAKERRANYTRKRERRRKRPRRNGGSSSSDEISEDIPEDYKTEITPRRSKRNRRPTKYLGNSSADAQKDFLDGQREALRVRWNLF